METSLPERAQPLAGDQLTKQLLDLLQSCASLKQIKKGANEVTKTLNRGISELIVIAVDATPIEIVLHLPLLCEDKNVPYVFLKSKKLLGKACGTSRNVIACSILKNQNSSLNTTIATMKQKCEQLFMTQNENDEEE